MHTIRCLSSTLLSQGCNTEIWLPLWEQWAKLTSKDRGGGEEALSDCWDPALESTASLSFQLPPPTPWEKLLLTPVSPGAKCHLEVLISSISLNSHLEPSGRTGQVRSSQTKPKTFFYNVCEIGM